MNIVINDSAWQEKDIATLYGDTNNNVDEEVRFVDEKPMPNLLVELGVFKSTSQARQAGRTGEIPKGWTQYKASRKVTLWIWNPTE
ncbi:MAG: hypothetical protein CMP47_12300 [Rickettsiales bacterium]|nr:hypothetical protein [Rickettsiales bacterium]|tara:strand:- start:547 stop:804 length:258 start_codon:yes stop_codon:yes gene_type:complete